MLADSVVTEVILGPLAYAGWLIVWWIWFGRRWSARLPGTVAILTVAYMVSFAIGKGLFYPAIPHPVAAKATMDAPSPRRAARTPIPKPARARA